MNQDHLIFRNENKQTFNIAFLALSESINILQVKIGNNTITKISCAFLYDFKHVHIVDETGYGITFNLQGIETKLLKSKGSD